MPFFAVQSFLGWRAVFLHDDAERLSRACGQTSNGTQVLLAPRSCSLIQNVECLNLAPLNVKSCTFGKKQSKANVYY